VTWALIEDVIGTRIRKKEQRRIAQTEEALAAIRSVAAAESQDAAAAAGTSIAGRS
jgi:hypothetical protein